MNSRPTQKPDTNTQFSQHTSRWGTASAKWDLLTAPLGVEAISLSVADMEFLTAPAVFESINQAAQHGIYGYTEIFPDFFEAAYRWQKVQHNWSPPTGSAIFFPRIVQCLSALLNHALLSSNNEIVKVTTLTPAYGPLIEVSRQCGAEICNVPLLPDKDGTYRIDWSTFEEAMQESDLLLWCNPHNPTGRVWSHEELRKTADLALMHNVLIFSDDIHADFTRPGVKYTPLITIAPELWEKELLLQCSSPGKTFNTAGLESAVVFAPPALHEHLSSAKRRLGIHNPNYFSVPATIAAWTQCDEWVDQLRKYIDTNLNFAIDYLRSHLPFATISNPEGTYLIWVEAREYLATTPISEIERLSRVGVSAGESFGEHYNGSFRLNVALPASELREALSRLCRALTQHKPYLHTPHENIGVSHDLNG